MVGYEDDATICSYSLTPFATSSDGVANYQDLVAIHFWCLKWHMRLNSNKSRSRTLAPGYSDLALFGAGLEEIQSLRIIGVKCESKFTFETHLRKVVSKTARSLCVVRWAGKLLDCPRVLERGLDAYVLSNLEYWALVWMPSAEPHLKVRGWTLFFGAQKEGSYVCSI